MKMVSQLTRQAMSRHRLLTASGRLPEYVPQPAPLPPPVQTTPYQPSDTLRPPEMSAAPPVMNPQPLQPVPRPHSAYQQLMKSHDRMTERHL